MAFTYKDYTQSDAVKLLQALTQQNSTYNESDEVKRLRALAQQSSTYTESDEVKRLKALADQNSTYNESDSVKAARDALTAHENNKVADWTGGTYGEALKAALDKYNNREAFKYDLNGDALYQQYKDQYINQGKLAMADTIGTASAMTGGYGNSYAATAGNQAYQSYLQKLNDVVPELYQIAYNKYTQEGQDMLNSFNMYANMYSNEYGEYRDKVSDWTTEANRLSDKYYNEANMDYSRFSDNRDYYTNQYNNAASMDYSRYADARDYYANQYYNAANLDYSRFSDNRDFYANQYNNERSYDYNMYADAYNRAFANYQQGVSEDQFKKNYELDVKNYALNELQTQITQNQNNADNIYRDAALEEEKRQYDLDNTYRYDVLNAKDTSADSTSSQSYKYSDYNTVDEKASTITDLDSLHSYLQLMVKDGFISQDAMDELYQKYAAKLKADVKDGQSSQSSKQKTAKTPLSYVHDTVAGSN